jgi:hypothetical protein
MMERVYIISIHPHRSMMENNQEYCWNTDKYM